MILHVEKMKKPYKIAVIDYRMSNMFSIKNALNMLGFESEITSDRARILASDGAILPGVGSFPEAMKHIKDLELETSIKDFITTGKPFMGICLGFQLLFEKSEEIEVTNGLGIMQGDVRNFLKINDKIRVPHVGWNTIKKNQALDATHSLNPLRDSEDDEYFYFVHSCYVKPEDKTNIYTTTEYAGIEFCSSVLKDNIFACQFHPEKSGEKGIGILNEMFSK